MCGIVGFIGNRNAHEIIEEGLSKLEYRGYDSAGIATFYNKNMNLIKDKGTFDEIFDDVDVLQGKRGIGHTRWATHGSVSQKNAHPHTCCQEEIVLVHNGIIENHNEIRDKIKDHEIISDTDSEIIAHYIEEKKEEGHSIFDSLKKFREIAEGTYAVLLMDKEENKLYCLKHKSPLALGVGDKENFVGSDIYAFSGYTDSAIFLEEGDIAIVEPGEIEIWNKDDVKVEREIKTFDWDHKQNTENKYNHHMIKEINEQPETTERLVRSFENDQKELIKEFKEKIKQAENVVLTAAGSSYHASMIAEQLLKQQGIETKSLIASEFTENDIKEGSLVIAVSQSGETMDVLDAIDKAKEKGCEVISVVNVPYSSIQRKSVTSIEILAGQEICVASTKTFINQVLTFFKLSNLLGSEYDISEIGYKISELISKNKKIIERISEKIMDEEDIYVIGRGSMYPVAREIALKLKEISYIHAEGLRGGELKHGTLALIEEGTPVISLIPDNKSDIISNVKEVESRGAYNLKISSSKDPFYIPDDDLFPIYATTIGFLLTYHIAKNKNLPIDKPRNLAKSVTVR